jgi:hypothetical protein
VKAGRGRKNRVARVAPRDHDARQQLEHIMNFIISGIDPSPYAHLMGAPEGVLRHAGAVRRRADAQPGFPCRVLLEDAALGDTLLLLNHESHSAPTPYRNAYAIYINERARRPARYENEIPPVMRGRPIALRQFSAAGMLINASLALKGDSKEQILAAFEDSDVAYIHAHNAAHGCFAARIDRG